MLRFVFVSHTFTKRSGWSNGSGRSRIPSTALKIALLAPIPSASARIADSANPGFLSSDRVAKRKSSKKIISSQRPSLELLALRNPVQRIGALRDLILELDRSLKWILLFLHQLQNFFD